MSIPLMSFTSSPEVGLGACNPPPQLFPGPSPVFLCGNVVRVLYNPGLDPRLITGEEYPEGIELGGLDENELPDLHIVPEAHTPRLTTSVYTAIWNNTSLSATPLMQSEGSLTLLATTSQSHGALTGSAPAPSPADIVHQLAASSASAAGMAPPGRASHQAGVLCFFFSLNFQAELELPPPFAHVFVGINV